MSKTFKPEPVWEYVVTGLKDGTTIFKETEWAARASDAEAAVLNRHRGEIRLFDPRFSVRTERSDASRS